MQKLRTFLLIVLTATIAAGLCAAPRKTSKKIKKPKVEKLAFPKLPPVADMKQPIAKGDTITLFSIERHMLSDDAPERSEIYYINNSKSKYSDDFFTGLYYRRYGTYTENYGHYYTEPEVKPALDSLAVAAAQLRLYDFDCNAVKDADKSRSRWIVEVEYLSGNKINIVEYIDDNAKADGEFILQNLRNIFENQISRTEATRNYRWLERTEYKPDGKWQRMMRYNNEGTVCGGDDADNPGLTY